MNGTVVLDAENERHVEKEVRSAGWLRDGEFGEVEYGAGYFVVHVWCWVLLIETSGKRGVVRGMELQCCSLE